MKAYEKQKHDDRKDIEELAEAANREKTAKFLEKEGSIVSKPINPFTKGQASSSKGEKLIITKGSEYLLYL